VGHPERPAFLKTMKRLSAAIFFLTLCCNAFGGTLVEVMIKDHVVMAVIASNPEEQAKGLMFKPTIADNEAMLFVYQRDNSYSFWMKNTKVALDIIWFDAGKRAVYIKENFLPCTKDPCPAETPPQKARYVLEVKSGTVKKTNFKLGDRVEFSLP
jgi:hypothetical protein